MSETFDPQQPPNNPPQPSTAPDLSTDSGADPPKPKRSRKSKPPRDKKPKNEDKGELSKRAAKKAAKRAKAPRRRKIAARKTKGRGLYVAGGILIVLLSIVAFVILLNSSREDTIKVLVSDVAINNDDTVFRDNFRIEEVPEDSGLDTLAPDAFDQLADGSVIARVDIAEGTVVNISMFIIAGAEGSEIERRVEFSIQIPGEGFAAGTPSVGDRVLLISYIPPSSAAPTDREYEPLQVETVTAVNGNRISFFAIPDRAANLVVTQISIGRKDGHIFLWEVSRDQDESEIVQSSFRGFLNAVNR